MSASSPIAGEIKQFICTDLVPDHDAAALGDDDSLLDSGILDSFGIMSLLALIQSRYGVKIPAEEIEPSNFETIAAIARTVANFRRE